MFNNIGPKMQGAAYIVFIAGTAVAFLDGIRFLAVHVLLGLAAAGFWILISYMSAMTLHGLGQLIESTKAIEDRLNRVERKINEQTRKTSCDEAVKADVRPKREERSGAPEVTRFDRPRPTEGMIVCPECGCEQKPDRKVCWKCGTKFVFEGESQTE